MTVSSSIFDVLDSKSTDDIMAQCNGVDRTVCPLYYYVGWINGWPTGFAGRTHTEETRAKMREASKHKILPEDFGEKVSKAKIGKKRKPFTEEHKRNMALAQIGKKHPKSEETKKQISESLKGHKQSEETKRKRSEALRKYHARRKQTS